MLDDESAEGVALSEAVACLVKMNNDYAYAITRAVRVVCRFTGMQPQVALGILFGERAGSMESLVKTYQALSEAFPDTFKIEVVSWGE